MKAEDYLKEHRIYDDETIYNNVGDIVGTLSQLMNDYHESVAAMKYGTIKKGYSK